jgi:Methyltransferase domain
MEHVHQPRDLLKLLAGAVKHGGWVFVSYPNPQSMVQDWFGRYWRGLEAPRHICLASRQSIVAELQALGIEKMVFHRTPIYTFGESVKLQNNGGIGGLAFVLDRVVKIFSSYLPGMVKQDFLEFAFRVGEAETPAQKAI